MTDEELSRLVLKPKSGYIRGLGHGPKPSSSISGQTSRAQLVRDVEEARQNATEAQKSYEEARMDAAEARKKTEELQEKFQLLETQQAEGLANMQSQLAWMQQHFGVTMPTFNASKYRYFFFFLFLNWPICNPNLL